MPGSKSKDHSKICNFISIPSSTKYLLILCCFSCTTIFPQETTSPLSYKKEKLNIPAVLTHDPITLSNALTNDLTTDKEKFDAIFSWVSSNIEYNWDQYYSSGGTGKPNVKKILRSKKGICGDYAFLMDTICSIANITNVTVTGYAKDELFDVTDSLYIGNHAWNAVKLDGKWYVYDITFSTGRKVYDYTPFSKLVLKWRQKLPFSIIARKIILNPADECSDTAETVTITQKIPRLKLLWGILYAIKLHTESTFDARMNTDFYLCEPHLFSITHYPEDPVWNLLPDYTERKFEADSSFYHLHDSIYQKQQRAGALCAGCDNALTLQEIPKHQYEKRQSLGSNRKNSFSPGLQNYYISAFYLRDARKADDSITKVTALDSSLTFLVRSRTDFSKGQAQIDNEFGQQKNKNRKKYTLLFDDNRQHVRFLNEKLSATSGQRKNLKELSSKVRARVRSCRRKQQLIGHFNMKFDKIENRTNESLIHQCRQKEKMEKKKIDSLSVAIDSLKQRFEAAIRLVSTQVWQQVLDHDSLIRPFGRSIYYREFGLDDYKKNIVETRRQLRINENKYEDALSATVYQPFAECAQLASKIFANMDAQYAFQKEEFETTRRLVKLGDADVSTLEILRNEILSSNRQHQCWLKRRSPFLKLTYKGLKALKDNQEIVKAAISYENHVESLRHKYINKELIRRRKKYKIIAGHNYRFVKGQYAMVKKYKNNYLGYLRKLRREARKQR